MRILDLRALVVVFICRNICGTGVDESSVLANQGPDNTHHCTTMSHLDASRCGCVFPEELLLTKAATAPVAPVIKTFKTLGTVASCTPVESGSLNCFKRFPLTNLSNLVVGRMSLSICNIAGEGTEPVPSPSFNQQTRCLTVASPGAWEASP